MEKKLSKDTKNTRMYVDDDVRFIMKMEELGCKSSAALIRKLMDISDKIGKITEVVNKNEIQLHMSFYTSVPTEKYLPLKKMSFPGDVRFCANTMYPVELTKTVWLNLQKEFFRNQAPVTYQEEDVYQFWHVLNLYYNQKVNRFFVIEGLRVLLRDECCEYIEYGYPQYLLEVWRGDFVADYADLHAKFSKYAHPGNLDALSTVLAEDIGENYDLLNNFFPLR